MIRCNPQKKNLRCSNFCIINLFPFLPGSRPCHNIITEKKVSSHAVNWITFYHSWHFSLMSWLTDWPNRKNTNQFQIFFLVLTSGVVDCIQHEKKCENQEAWKEKKNLLSRIKSKGPKLLLARQSRYTNCPFSPLPLFGSSCIAKFLFPAVLKVFSASF